MLTIEYWQLERKNLEYQIKVIIIITKFWSGFYTKMAANKLNNKHDIIT